MAYKAFFPLDNMAEPTFEECFLRLEHIVQKLQQGGLTLVESLSLFEEGMGLARQCSERLTAAELKVTELRSAFLEDLPSEGDYPPDMIT